MVDMSPQVGRQVAKLEETGYKAGATKWSVGAVSVGTGTIAALGGLTSVLVLAPAVVTALAVTAVGTGVFAGLSWALEAVSHGAAARIQKGG